MTREEAIICLKGIKNYGRDTFTSKSQGDWQESLDMAIEALEQEPRWIPVSERLPEDDVNVLICDIDGDVYIAYMRNIIYANRIAWSDASSFDNIKNVIAWMPLPEPYKSQESEDKE